MELNAVINNFTLPIDAPCSLLHIHHMLIYYIPPPRKCKLCRWALQPTQLWIQYQSTKWDNYNEGGNISSPYAKPGAILTRVKECLSAGVSNVEAMVRPSESMKKQSMIPLPLVKADIAACLGRSILLFWMVLWSCMLLVLLFWIIKFSGVLHEHKGELMILNSNADKNGSSMVKGGAFVWKEWVRLQFQCRGVINLDFLIDQEGSMMWCRRKKSRLLFSQSHCSGQSHCFRWFYEAACCWSLSFG